MTTSILDPIKFVNLVWPDVKLYSLQRDIMYSVRDNDETVVPAGNGLGKDFVSALIALWFFCSRRPARVVTTSVKADQLNDVLWGEMRRFLNTARVNLPIKYNHLHIRQIYRDGGYVPLCELVGQAVNKGEALLGRHLPRDIPRTLVIFDEASGIDNHVFESTDTWAHRKLIIGNCYPTTNYFFRATEEGDIPRPNGQGYYRKIIRIKAEDSPNVRYAEAQIANGIEPTHETLIPGVVDYETYQKRRQLWDSVRQCIGLDAAFWKGKESLMFPPEWLNHAEGVARHYVKDRKGRAIGVDTAEGGDKTAMCCVDENGIIEIVSKKTPDTAVIKGEIVAFARKYGVDPAYVLLDTGGGGKQIADQLRAEGFDCETTGFGEKVTPEKTRGLRTLKERKLSDEERYAYVNRRAQLYGTFRQLLDPTEGGFGIPSEYAELRRQLAPIPLTYDGEGRVYLLPKRKKEGANKSQKCLEDLIGCSPDEADATVLAVFRMLYKPRRFIVG